MTDVFLGPLCEYVIAPVARYAGYWDIPVMTPGAQAEAFRHKKPTFPTLIRMAGTYSFVGEAFSKILARFGWRHVALFYHNFAVASGKGHHLCHFVLSAVFTALNRTAVHQSFDETKDQDFRSTLKFIGSKARSELLSSL